MLQGCFVDLDVIWETAGTHSSLADRSTDVLDREELPQLRPAAKLAICFACWQTLWTLSLKGVDVLCVTGCQGFQALLNESPIARSLWWCIPVAGRFVIRTKAEWRAKAARILQAN